MRIVLHLSDGFEIFWLDKLFNTFILFTSDFFQILF